MLPYANILPSFDDILEAVAPHLKARPGDGKDVAALLLGLGHTVLRLF